jgi:tetratricopeptide (TPR) repeat protein
MDTILFYRKLVKILQTILPVNRISLACYSNNIGQIYQRMQEYSTALSSYEKVLEI